MKIRKTQIEELELVMQIYANARAFMEAHGNPNQWGKTKPLREDVERDIAQGKSYVCVDNHEIVGVFYFAIESDPTYVEIYDGAWKNEERYGVVHRIASSGKKKGVGSFCLQWAYEQCKNLKIDTHRENVVMQNLLRKNDFQYCGIIYLLDGNERLAYQKTENA